MLRPWPLWLTTLLLTIPCPRPLFYPLYYWGYKIASLSASAHNPELAQLLQSHLTNSNQFRTEPLVPLSPPQNTSSGNESLWKTFLSLAWRSAFPDSSEVPSLTQSINSILWADKLLPVFGWLDFSSISIYLKVPALFYIKTFP